MTPAARTIALADGLDLPLLMAASQVYAFMGRRGSGKTYACGRLVEQLLEHSGQVVIIDPVGVWWGLRFLADGKTPSGFDVPVFGGWHGDLPLPPTAGKVFAELVATRSTSMVLDVSDMTGADQRRFVADFCAELFHAKKRARSPLLVVFEESQEFVPQHVRGDVAKMVGAVERLIKLGRNYGVGAALISQRPQAVNKDVLNQAEVMLAFQLSGPQERKAIEGWVQQTGAGDRGIADELPGLKPGTAKVWSPQWLRKFGEFRILKKKTYDASATPEGRDDLTRKLPPIDLEEVRGALKTVADEIAGNDVDALKAEIRRLTKHLRDGQDQLAWAKGQKAKAADPPKVVERTVEVVPARVLRQLEAFEAKAVKISRDLEAANVAAIAQLASIQAASIGLRKELDATRGAVKPANGVSMKVTTTTGNPTRSNAAYYGTPPGPPGKTEGVASDLKAGAGRLLAILQARHPDRLTNEQLAVLAVMTRSGGTYSTYMGKLVGLGYVDRRGNTVGVTAAGLAQPTNPVDLDPRSVIDAWKGQYGIKGKMRDILETLANEHEATPDSLCERLEMTKTGGTWSTYRGKLVGLGLIHPADGGKLRIIPELAL